MAATSSPVGSFPPGGQVPGARRRVLAQVNFDNSYPTGGYALTPAFFGLSALDTVDCGSVSQAGTRLVSWDQVNGKLKVYSALGTEVVNTTDIHTDSVIVEAFGI
jgi:hypothetical protein